MGNWSITGIGIMVGLFFLIFGFILSQINIDNPYTGNETSVFQMIIGWLSPF